jgi:hypothetical protein
MKILWCDGQELTAMDDLRGRKEYRFLCFTDGAGERHLVLSDKDGLLHSRIQAAVFAVHPDWTQIAAGYSTLSSGWIFNTTSTEPERPKNRAEAKKLLAEIDEAGAAAGHPLKRRL